MKFCKICNNMLQINIHNEQLMFRCNNCNRIYKSENVDTLRYEFSKKSDFNIYKQQLKNANKDPTNIKAYIDCPKCNHYICKQVELSSDLKLFNICINCKYTWLYGDKK